METPDPNKYGGNNSNCAQIGLVDCDKRFNDYNCGLKCDSSYFGPKGKALSSLFTEQVTILGLFSVYDESDYIVGDIFILQILVLHVVSVICGYEIACTC